MEIEQIYLDQQIELHRKQYQSWGFIGNPLLKALETTLQKYIEERNKTIVSNPELADIQVKCREFAKKYINGKINELVNKMNKTVL